MKGYDPFQDAAKRQHSDMLRDVVRKVCREGQLDSEMDSGRVEGTR